MSAGQPPGWRLPTSSIALGQGEKRGRVRRCPASRTPSRAVGRSDRGSLRPWLVTSGRTPVRRSSRTWRTPAPFGPHSHLWPLPVQYAAPSALTSTGHLARGMRRIDERVDAEAIQLADDRLDREDEAADAGHVADQRQPRPRRHAGEDRLDDLLGMADRERDRDPDDPPSRSLRDGRQGVERGVVLVVVREQLVAGPQPEATRARSRRRSSRSGTTTRPSGSAFRNAATASRAASSRPSSSRVRKRSGLASSSATSACCASRIGRGQAPYVPWVRIRDARLRSPTGCLGSTGASRPSIATGGLPEPARRRSKQVRAISSLRPGPPGSAWRASSPPSIRLCTNTSAPTVTSARSPSLRAGVNDRRVVGRDGLRAAAGLGDRQRPAADRLRPSRGRAGARSARRRDP